MKSYEADNMLTKAESLLSSGCHDEALKILNALAEKEDASKAAVAQAYFMMANTFHLRGEIGKSIKAFNKCLSVEPGHTDAAISLSVVYNDIGKYEEAKKVFEQANSRVKQPKDNNHFEDDHISKKFALKHFEIAEMYMTYNRLDEALFEFNKVVSLDPTYLEARVRVAKVYAKKNFISKSFDELRKLKNEFPDYLPARIALGVLYYGCGKVLEAQSEWQRVLVKDSRNEEAAMYLNLSKTATETSL